jgi:ABC-type lipoprotein export system ATPase subunit
VAVARALMNRPELMLADEPTGNQGRASASQVRDMIAEINREEGTTFLISTHDEKIAALCRRQIVVGDGLVTGWGSSRLPPAPRYSLVRSSKISVKARACDFFFSTNWSTWFGGP